MSEEERPEEPEPAEPETPQTSVHEQTVWPVPGEALDARERSAAADPGEGEPS